MTVHEACRNARPHLRAAIDALNENDKMRNGVAVRLLRTVARVLHYRGTNVIKAVRQVKPRAR